MSKSSSGSVKSKKLFKIARVFALTGLGISLAALGGTLGAVFGSMGVDKDKANYLEAVSQTAEYQEYFEGEKTALEDALYGKEITIDEYNVKFDELKNEGVEKFIDGQGTEEQKGQLEKFEHKKEAAQTAGTVFRFINFAAIASTTTGVSTTLAASIKSKKEFNEEMRELEDGIKRLERDINPFEEFEEDQIELPNIEEYEKN